MVDLNGVSLKTFPSISSVARELGVKDYKVKSFIKNKTILEKSKYLIWKEKNL